MNLKIVEQLLLATLVLLTVIGCTSRASYVPDPSLSSDNAANITIYRTRMSFHSLNPEKPFVYIDEKEIGKLGVGEVINIKAAPGEHRFSIRVPFLFQPSSEVHVVTATLESGRTYYLRYSLELGDPPLAAGTLQSVSTFNIVPASIGEAKK